MDLHLQDEEKGDERLKNIEQEIECPCCNYIMTLTSDFDKLYMFVKNVTSCL